MSFYKTEMITDRTVEDLQKKVNKFLITKDSNSIDGLTFTDSEGWYTVYIIYKIKK